MAKKVIAGSTVSARQLKDFFRQIDDGSITGLALQAFLERRNPFEQATLPTIFVLEGCSLVDRITVGRYGWVNENFTESNFPHDPTTVGEWEWKLFYFGRMISSEKNAVAMATDRWDPAKVEHLLAFGAQYPEEQRKGTIVAHASSCRVDGNRYLPILWADDARRKLDLGYWSGDWRGIYRVLVVRKKV